MNGFTFCLRPILRGRHAAHGLLRMTAVVWFLRYVATPPRRWLPSGSTRNGCGNSSGCNRRADRRAPLSRPPALHSVGMKFS